MTCHTYSRPRHHQQPNAQAKAMHPYRNHVWRRLWPVCCFLISGCSMFSQVRSRTDIPRIPEEQYPPAREFLMDGFDEDEPKTFHAYFIIEEDKPGKGEQERREALAEAFWRGFQFNLPPAQPMIPSVIYWPITGISPAEARLAVERGHWEALADNYQHQRAKLIMQRVQDLAGVGPFFILAFQPLGQVVKPFAWMEYPLLIIDFSVIPKEKFISLAQIVCRQIMGNPHILDKPWKVEEIRGYFRGLLGSETDNAVWVKF